MKSDRFNLFKVTFTAEIVVRADVSAPNAEWLHEQIAVKLKEHGTNHFYVGRTTVNISQEK